MSDIARAYAARERLQDHMDELVDEDCIDPYDEYVDNCMADNVNRSIAWRYGY